MNKLQERMDKILPNGKTIIVPMDHLWIWTGYIDNYPNWLVEEISESANCIIDHLWPIKRMDINSRIAKILHFSLSWLNPETANSKVLVNRVKTAVKLWVDGVSLQINLWDIDENRMLEEAWILAWECLENDLPLLAMMYYRTKDNWKPSQDIFEKLPMYAYKIGADIIKMPYPWDKDLMKKITKNIPVPIVIAWWEKDSKENIINIIGSAMEDWCAWVCMWRNIFTADDRGNFLSIIKEMIHNNLSVEDAMKRILKNK